MKRSQLVTSCIAWCSFLLILPVVYAAPRVEGDRYLLEALIAAQETHMAQFPRGQLKARVLSFPGKVLGPWTIQVEAAVVWDGDKTYWNYDMTEPVVHTPDATSERGMSRVHHSVQMAQVRDLLLWYNRDANLAQMNQDGKTTFRKELKVRPADIWYSYEGNANWKDVLSPDHRVSRGVEKFVVRQPDQDHVVVERYLGTPEEYRGTGTRIVVSMKQGGNIIRYETINAENASYDRTGSYDWGRTMDGRWFLKRLQYRTIPSRSGRGRNYTYTLEIDEFNPEPSIPANRFDFSSFGLKPGTKIEEVYADSKKNRTYTYGKGPDALDDAKLDELSQKLRDGGFASPK